MSISEHASKPSHGMKHGYVICISWGVPRKWEGGGARFFLDLEICMS